MVRARNGVGVIAYGPLAHGLLTGKMDADDDLRGRRLARRRASSSPTTPSPSASRSCAELDEVAREAGRPGGVAELAVAWVLRRPEVTVGDHRRALRRAGHAQRRPGGRAAVARRGGARSTRCSRATPTPSRPYGHGEPPGPVIATPDGALG